MKEQELDDIVALLPPLLRSLEVLGFIARHLNPPDFASVMAAAGTPEAGLPEARARLAGWPDELGQARQILEGAIDETLAAFGELRAAEAQGGEMMLVYRALRHAPRAQETLYGLAAELAPVSRYFLEPATRGDAELQARLAGAPARDDTGVLHFANDPGSRGGFSLYAPEYYSPDLAMPFVMALHGGSGNGRSFLWSWLRDARSHGAIVAAPTALGNTWDLHGGDEDTANLHSILDEVRARWNIDPARLLLTGMSDGGTFSYVIGLQAESRFTHLAPIAAAFHPMLVQLADGDRLRGLPIHIAHGALDWMFPVMLARQAQQFLSATGARVTYREIEDLSHTYPSELNPVLLEWLRTTAG